MTDLKSVPGVGCHEAFDADDLARVVLDAPATGARQVEDELEACRACITALKLQLTTVREENDRLRAESAEAWAEDMTMLGYLINYGGLERDTPANALAEFRAWLARPHPDAGKKGGRNASV